MKKIIYIGILVITCLILVQYIVSNLERALNLVMIEFSGNLTHRQNQQIDEYVKTDKSISKFSIYYIRNDTLNAYHKLFEDVSIYYVDEHFTDFYRLKMRTGRFIWSNDKNEKKNYIVLEEKIAVYLFATPECIGRKIKIEQQEYTVIGVCNNDTSTLGMVSSTDFNKVYIPFTPGKDENRYILMLRVKDSISIFAERSIKAVLESILGDVIILENMDIKARMSLQKCKFLYICIVVIFIFYFIKRVVAISKKYYSQIKNQIQNYYYPQVIMLNIKRLLILLFIVIIAIASGYYLFRAIKFELIVDPQIIPMSLIDTEEIRNKFQAYFIRFNKEIGIASYFHSLIYHSNNFLNYIGTILVLSFWKIMQITFQKLNKKYNL